MDPVIYEALHRAARQGIPRHGAHAYRAGHPGTDGKPGRGDDDLIVHRPEGLYCPAGDFYIDPWRPVERAVITHAHADHARPGHAHYLAHRAVGEGVLRARLGDIALQTAGLRRSGRAPRRARVAASRPATCSARRRCVSSMAGRVWVASGDYKVEPDPHLRAVRAGALRHLHHRVDLRPADLPLAPGAVFARHRRLVGRATPQPAGHRCSLLRVRQGAADARGRRPGDRPDRRARRGRAAEPRVSRRRRGAARDAAACTTSPTADLKRALVLAPPRRRDALAEALRRRCARFASGWMQLRGTRRRRGSTAASCCPTTPTGRA